MKKSIVILINAIFPYMAILTHSALTILALIIGLFISGVFFTGLNKKRETKPLGDIAALTYLIGLFIAVTVQYTKSL